MKIQIQKGAWDKIVAFTDLCPDEISGLGKIEKIDGQLIVTDVAIFDQVVTSADSDIKTEALAKFQDERVRAGESMKPWCFWWHSHAQMSVFFSGTDTGTMERSTEFPYLVSLVTNKKHETKARLDVYSPVHMFIDLEVEILEAPINDEIKTACQAEIDAKVKSSRGVTYVPQTRTWNPQTKQFDWENPMGFGRQRENFHNQNNRNKQNRKKPWEKDANDFWILDNEARLEYWEHRDWLKKQIEHLRKVQTPSKKQVLKLNSLEDQLKTHINWGRLMKIEPVDGKTTFLPSVRDIMESVEREERDW